MTPGEILQFAAYTARDSSGAVRIKDVNVDNVKTKLGLKSAAYSETSAFAAATHTHTKSQITDFPTSLPANGGTADTAKNLSSFGIPYNRPIASGGSGKQWIKFAEVVDNEITTASRWYSRALEFEIFNNGYGSNGNFVSMGRVSLCVSVHNQKTFTKEAITIKWQNCKPNAYTINHIVAVVTDTKVEFFVLNDVWDTALTFVITRDIGIAYGSTYTSTQYTSDDFATYYSDKKIIQGSLDTNLYVYNSTKVNNHTVETDVPADAKFTDTNTWRGIQNNLTSDSTTDSLSAAQGKVLKGLVDGKAASNHTHSYLPLAGGEMNGAVKWNSNSLPQQTAAVKYLVCIDAFADGGTMKWQSVENITVGNATKANGHTVNSDVPANAKFTDTVYTLPAATSSTLGGVKIGSNITNSSGTISLTKANVTAALGYTPPTTNTTYGVATSSALGLVKSGTDITVDSNGNVSVNDDSHNHIIGNVDGLQSALDGKAAASHTHDYAASSHTHTTQSSAATSDANASYLRQIATGTAAATTSNCPAGTLYGKY